MGHVLLSRKGVGSRDEGRWCAKQDWAPYQHPQTEPRPHRFLLRFFSTSGPALALPSRGQANLLFQSSCFNVLVALPPLLSRDPPPSVSFPAFPPSAYRPHSRIPGVGPQCSIHRATKRTAQASADLPGSHFRLDGNLRDTRRFDIVFVLLSIPLIAEDLNSQTVRGVYGARGQFEILLWIFKIAVH